MTLQPIFKLGDEHRTEPVRVSQREVVSTEEIGERGVHEDPQPAPRWSRPPVVVAGLISTSSINGTPVVEL
ncbi:hypothetical protein ACLM5J_07725, partial [Nocardioides sp. Bht2]|uniref:hypothetical protein n=1 Tax=Nocardioides sp. Bht2 TaxID=3392297 RepID=UPI0039B4273B